MNPALSLNAAAAAIPLEQSACFHCGLPVPAETHYRVRVDDVEQAMCCPGCEAVAQAIVDSGLGDYYKTRSGYSQTARDGQALVPDALRLLDAEEEQQRYASSAGDLREAVFSVEGIRCAACVWLIERRLSRLPGVEQASMNVATERLHLRWNPAQCQPSSVLESLGGIGYTAYPCDPVRQGAQLQKAAKKLFRQTFIAGLSMMQVMMYAVPVYMASDMDADMESLMRWASLFLTLPAVLYSARPFFAGAWNSLKSRSLGMDVPVALGIAAAFIASMVATLRGQGEVYFDSVTMFIFLLLCSRYVELLARRKASTALERLQHALPASATRIDSNGKDEVVSAAQLAAGDVIRVRPGEAFAVDGCLLQGTTTVDLSLLSGESRPQRRQIGETIPGGAVNADQPVLLRVTRPLAESTLSSLLRLAERAGLAKPRLAQWADRVAAWFVLALLVLSVGVLLAWSVIDPARAWPVAIAVLVVSCPCALSLATPSALAAATDALARQGVLVVQPHVMETLHRATHVVFDKTGTLTLGQPVLQSCTLLAPQTHERERVLQLAAALEASSLHPLGRALLAAASELPALQATNVQSQPGEGLEGMVDGEMYRIGRRAWVQALAGPVPDAVPTEEGSAVWLGCRGQWLACFALDDALRPEAAGVLQRLREAGKTVLLLSGDNQASVDRVASQLGIAQALGGQSPQDKLDFVQALQHQGAVVAMVGDGINDTAVLKAADVSFALASGAALAQAHADTVLLSGRLHGIWQAAHGARRAMMVVRQNLWWASLYNLLAIPAAALGWINPWLSGLGMSASSALVLLNALRLSRIPRHPEED